MLINIPCILSMCAVTVRENDIWANIKMIVMSQKIENVDNFWFLGVNTGTCFSLSSECINMFIGLLFKNNNNYSNTIK